MRLKIIYWFARILAIAYVLFISIFALDAFQGDATAGEKMTAFIIHLIPSLVLVALLIVAWRHQLTGAILFLLAGLLFTFFYSSLETAPTFLCLSCPLLLVGVLFLIEYALLRNRRKKEN